MLIIHCKNTSINKKCIHTSKLPPIIDGCLLIAYAHVLDHSKARAPRLGSRPLHLGGPMGLGRAHRICNKQSIGHRAQCNDMYIYIYIYIYINIMQTYIEHMLH